MIETIAKRILAVGIEIASVEPRTETVRSWRTALETRSSSLGRRSEALRACARLLEELPRRREELTHAEERLQNVNSRLALAMKGTSEVGDRLRKRTAQIDRLEGRLRYLVGRQDTLAWVEKNEELHVALQTEVASTSERLTHRAQDLDHLCDREKSLLGMLHDREARRASATRALAETQSELQLGRTIRETIDGWQAKTKRLRSIAEEEEGLKKSVLEVRRSEERLRFALHAAVEEEHRLSVQIETIEAKRGELSDLIGAFEDHIEGGVCPTCGQDHGSRWGLLERISAQLGRDVATDERVSRNAVRTRIGQLRVVHGGGRGKSKNADAPA